METWTKSNGTILGKNFVTYHHAFLDITVCPMFRPKAKTCSGDAGHGVIRTGWMITDHRQVPNHLKLTGRSFSTLARAKAAVEKEAAMWPAS